MAPSSSTDAQSVRTTLFPYALLSYGRNGVDTNRAASQLRRGRKCKSRTFLAASIASAWQKHGYNSGAAAMAHAHGQLLGQHQLPKATHTSISIPVAAIH